MSEVRVVCIDDSNKPAEIPARKWIKKGNEYEVLWVYWCVPKQAFSVTLAEIELDESCAPYESFELKRFRIPDDMIMAFWKLANECNNFDDVNISEKAFEEQFEYID